MKSIQYTSTGSADVLEIVERDIPSVGPGEVRVRVVLSGVNPTDTKSRDGFGAPSAPLPEPQIPNQDGAGIVDGVGTGVALFVPGDRVWVFDAAFQRREGTAQEFVVLPERQVVALPLTASFEEGASLGIPALTAHRALTASDSGPRRLSPGALVGTTVLVAGGAGVVGHAAIQLAVWAGATVITTVSGEEKATLATRAGADHILDYPTEDVVARVAELAPDGVDTIVEVNPAANLENDLRMIALGGTIALYSNDGEQELSMPIRLGMGKNARLQFIMTYTTTREQKADAVASVAAALVDGALGVGAEHGLPLTRFSLEQTAAAHRAVENKTVGKVLVEVAPA